MHWILQNNIFKEDGFNKVVDTLERFNIPYSIHKIVPFVGEILPDISPEGNVICMGSYSLRHLAKQRNWFPGVFDLEPFNFNVQLARWGDRLLNADAIVSKFEDAKIVGARAFIRPIEDSKVFAGNIFTDTALRSWQESILKLKEDTGTSMNGDTLVQVCPIKEIFAEYRYWIVDGKICTKSMYKRGEEVYYSPQVDERFDEYVQDCIDSWSPMKEFVIDVADTSEGLKIVEINTLNSSGYYAGDVQKLVLALEEKYG